MAARGAAAERGGAEIGRRGQLRAGTVEADPVRPRARGPFVGLAAALVLGVAGVFSRPLNDVGLGDLSAGQVQSLMNGAVNYALAAVAAGVVSRVLTRTSEEVRAANEQVIRERERAA